MSEYSLVPSGQSINSALDDGFYDALRGIKQARELGRYACQRQAMRIECRVRNLTGAHGCQHGVEILQRRVAAAKQGRFALVEFGVRKLDVVPHNGNEHV